MSFDPEFEAFRMDRAQKQSINDEFTKLTKKWIEKSVEVKYTYGFDWLGVPIIQYPSDLIAFQEIVYLTKPSLIIECGVARGGSTIFWASLQQLVGVSPNVIGVDIEIRKHAKVAISSSIYTKNIKLIEGSSIERKTFEKVKSLVSPRDTVMVVLDSNHTYEHVLSELDLYAPLVTLNAYLLVLDTVIEDLPRDPDRPWGPGSSPKTAVLEYMKNRNDFLNAEEIESRVGITVAPKGYWKRVAI